eukprot:7571286-Pyramimonas_sp.AAC.1
MRIRHADCASLDLRRSPPWGHEMCGCVPNRVRVRHADCAIGAFGGAPYMVAKRVRGVPSRAR